MRLDQFDQEPKPHWDTRHHFGIHHFENDSPPVDVLREAVLRVSGERSPIYHWGCESVAKGQVDL